MDIWIIVMGLHKSRCLRPCASGDKTALRTFMKQVGARIGSNDSGAEIRALPTSMGRKVGKNDASIISGAARNNATVITRDTDMKKFMTAAGFPFKTF